MDLIWDHTFGKQEQQDLVICRPLARLDQGDEEDDMICRGWLALDHPVMGTEVWYQSRSTRISMVDYRCRWQTPEYEGQEIGYKLIEANEMVNLLGLPHIYQQYMKRKKFTCDYDPFAHYHRRDRFLIFYLGTPDNIVGFTKLKLYSDQANYRIDDIDGFMCIGAESVIHANTVPIGAECLELELQWARSESIPYFYMGSGYEQSSEYKAKWRGFQWWTGIEWSTNKRQYRRLCRRDSRLTTFSALGNLSLIPDKF